MHVTVELQQIHARGMSRASALHAMDCGSFKMACKSTFYSIDFWPRDTTTSCIPRGFLLDAWNRHRQQVSDPWHSESATDDIHGGSQAGSAGPACRHNTRENWRHHARVSSLCCSCRFSHYLAVQWGRQDSCGVSSGMPVLLAKQKIWNVLHRSCCVVSSSTQSVSFCGVHRIAQGSHCDGLFRCGGWLSHSMIDHTMACTIIWHAITDRLTQELTDACSLNWCKT